MSKRNSEYARIPRDQVDTPPEPLDALLGALNLPPLLWERCPGAGKLVTRLRERGFTVMDSSPQDFLAPQVKLLSKKIGAILTSPPFCIAGDFIRKPLQLLMSAASLGC